MRPEGTIPTNGVKFAAIDVHNPELVTEILRYAAAFTRRLAAARDFRGTVVSMGEPIIIRFTLEGGEQHEVELKVNDLRIAPSGVHHALLKATDWQSLQHLAVNPNPGQTFDCYFQVRLDLDAIRNGDATYTAGVQLVPFMVMVDRQLLSDYAAVMAGLSYCMI